MFAYLAMQSRWLIFVVFLGADDVLAAELAKGWPTRSQNARRTGQSPVQGARTAEHVWKYTATGGTVINIEAAVTERGVFFGTWGLVRRHGAEKKDWDKFDGKIYGLDLKTGKQLWEPLLPAKTPYAYKYDKRKPTVQDRPAGPGMHWNWYNGTVEGTPAFDADGKRFYVGRGDGNLYCVDALSGKLIWTFRTIDPARPDDPEGGGEVVGGPLVTPGGLIVIGTFAAPHRPNPPKKIRHETNAVYAVDRKGKMRWRYPKKGTKELVFSAPPALSPDGKRAYLATNLPDGKTAGELIAIEVKTGRIAWVRDIGHRGVQDIAVSNDGTVFLAGHEHRGPVMPMVMAVKDEKKSSRVAWGPIYVDGEKAKSHWAGGVSLNEQRGKLRDVYVSTTTLRNVNSPAGRMVRLDPATGKQTAVWNPAEAAPKCIGGLTDISLDRDGVVYVGVRGLWKSFTKDEVLGRMYALQPKDDTFKVLWSVEVDGQIDWASPAIGPDGGVFFGSSDRLRGFAFPLPKLPGAKVKDADPIFYGVRDW